MTTQEYKEQLTILIDEYKDFLTSIIKTNGYKYSDRYVIDFCLDVKRIKAEIVDTRDNIIPIYTYSEAETVITRYKGLLMVNKEEWIKLKSYSDKVRPK